MKTVLKRFVSSCTRFVGLDLLIRLSGQRLVLPFYHAVSDEDPVHLKYLYPVPTIARFTRDLDFFLAHFRPVSHTFLNDVVQHRIAPQENCFFLSFDDGLREFYETVAPLLLRRGIPATCFINTAFVDNHDMFFRMKASILVDRIKRRELTSGQRKAVAAMFATYKLTYRSAYDLLRITYGNKELLDRLAPVVGVSFSDYRSAHKPYLTTSQIRDLIGKGFSVGAHSVSHPYYPGLPEETQVQQTLECLDHLKDQFHVKERLFSFPHTDFAVRKSFFDRIRSHVDLSFGSASLKQDAIETNLQRTPMEVSGYSGAEAIIKPEYLYYILKKMAGKHIIHRR